MRVLHPAAPLLVLAAVLAGCGDGSPAEPDAPAVAQLTVNAESGWALVDLGDPARVVTGSEPARATDWDIGFFGTGVMLNGGDAGPGGVVGYCVCQNQGASDAQVKAMTPESELGDFQAVGAAQLPTADSLWRSDALVPAIAGWYRYDAATRVVSAAPERSWKVRTAEGTAFAKLRVAKLEGPTRTHAGRVTLEYAVQSAAGAPMGEVRQLSVDLAAGGVYIDLVKGAVSDAADWDLRLEGYTLRVNGGVSGRGQAGAVPGAEPFAQIGTASDIPAQVYKADAFGGVFDARRWYRYNLDGSHQVWPTYDVYLVRRGSEIYKVQLTGYYGPAGESRRVTFRYAKLAG